MADISKTVKAPAKVRFSFESFTASDTLLPKESGKLCKFNSASTVILSLPPASKSRPGEYFDFVIDTAATSGVGHSVSPSANDKIFIPGATNVDNKDLYWPTATDAVGNGARIVSDGVDGWHVVWVTGTFAKEA